VQFNQHFRNRLKQQWTNKQQTSKAISWSVYIIDYPTVINICPCADQCHTFCTVCSLSSCKMRTCFTWHPQFFLEHGLLKKVLLPSLRWKTKFLDNQEILGQKLTEGSGSFGDIAPKAQQCHCFFLRPLNVRSKNLPMQHQAIGGKIEVGQPFLKSHTNAAVPLSNAVLLRLTFYSGQQIVVYLIRFRIYVCVLNFILPLVFEVPVARGVSLSSNG